MPLKGFDYDDLFSEETPGQDEDTLSLPDEPMVPAQAQEPQSQPQPEAQPEQQAEEPAPEPEEVVQEVREASNGTGLKGYENIEDYDRESETFGLDTWEDVQNARKVVEQERFMEENPRPEGWLEKIASAYGRTTNELAASANELSAGLGDMPASVGLETMYRIGLVTEEDYQEATATKEAADEYRDKFKEAAENAPWWNPLQRFIGLMAVSAEQKGDLRAGANRYWKEAEKHPVSQDVIDLEKSESLDELTSPTWYLERLGPEAARMAIAAAATAGSRSPTAGAAIMGGDIYGRKLKQSIRWLEEHRKDLNYGEREALAQGMAAQSAVTEYITEKIPLGLMFKKMRGGSIISKNGFANRISDFMSKTRLGRRVTAAAMRGTNVLDDLFEKPVARFAGTTAAEAIQEPVAGVAERMVEYLLGDPDALEGNVKEMIVEAVGGAAIGGFVGAVPTIAQEFTANAPQQRQLRVEAMRRTANKIASTPEGLAKLGELASKEYPSRKNFIEAGFDKDSIGNAAERMDLASQFAPDVIQQRQDKEAAAQAHAERGPVVEQPQVLSQPATDAPALKQLKEQAGKLTQPSSKQLAGPQFVRKMQGERKQLAKNIEETYDVKPMMAQSIAEVVQSTLTPEEVSLISFERGGKPGDSALYQIAETVEKIKNNPDVNPTGNEKVFFGKILPKHWEQTKKELGQTSGLGLTKQAKALPKDKLNKTTGQDFEKHFNNRGTKKILERAVEDYRKFIDNNPEFEQYYEQEVKEERKQLVRQYPELADDSSFQFYRMINGIASAQTELGKNTEETIAAYGGFRQTGRIPVVIGQRKGKVLKSGKRQVKDAPVYQIPANKRPITGTEAADAATAHEFDTTIKSDVDNVVNVMNELESIIPQEVMDVLAGKAPIPEGTKIIDAAQIKKKKGDPVDTEKEYLYNHAAPKYITSEIAKRANTTSKPLVLKMFMEWKGYDQGTRESDFRNRVRTAFEIGGGSSQYNKARNYKVLNGLLGLDQFKKEDGTPDINALMEWLNERVPWKQLSDERVSMGFGAMGNKADIIDTVWTAEGQQELIPRTFIFGPKVGAYMLNRMADAHPKNADYNTMDVWESRFWRGFNNDLKDDDIGIASGVPRKVYMRQAREFVKEYEKQTGKPLKVSAGQAGRWYLMKTAVAEAGYLKAGRDETIAGFTGELIDRYTRQQLNALQPDVYDTDAALTREFGDVDDVVEAFDVDPEEAGFQAKTELLGGPEGQGGIARVLFQRSGKEIRGAMERLPGGKVLLRGLTNPTVDTAIEEIAHGLRAMVFDTSVPERLRPVNDAQLQAIHRWAHETSQKLPDDVETWTREAEERFAEAFRIYMGEGKAPVNRLQKSFNRIANVLNKIWRKMKGAPNVEINQDLQNAFDKLMTRREDLLIQGEWSPEVGADSAALVKQAKSDGGFTVDANTGKPKTSGFAFAPRKDTEVMIPLEDVTPQDIDDYMAEWSDELAEPGNYLGGWIEDGSLWLDVSKVGDRARAESDALASDQEAIFDLGTFTTWKRNPETGRYDIEVKDEEGGDQEPAPAIDAIEAPKAGIPSEFVRPDGTVRLHRFSESDRGETYDIDPSKTKPRSVSRNDYNMASTPRTFHYLDPGQREEGIIGKNEYISTVDAGEIYNLIKDPDGIKVKNKTGNRYDFDAMFKDVIDAGYSGVYYKPAGRHVVNMFKPVKGTRKDVLQVQEEADDRPEGVTEPAAEPAQTDEPAAIRRGVGRRRTVRATPATEGQETQVEAIERAPLPSEERQADTERTGLSLATEPIGRGESAWSRTEKGELSAKPISKREAVRNILDRIGLTAVENFKGIAPTAVGYYKKARLGLGQGGVGLAIRRRELADIGVAVHEAVHYYDDLLGVTDLNRPITESTAKNLDPGELLALANESYQPQGERTLKEGFAEAVRLMVMVDNPRSAFRSQLAHDAATKMIEASGNEKLKQFIQDSRKDVEQYMAQTDAEKISRAMVSQRSPIVDPGESYFARNARGRYGLKAAVQFLERNLVNDRRDAAAAANEVERRFKEFWNAHNPEPGKSANKAWAEVVRASGGRFDQKLLQHSNFTRARTEEMVIGTDENPGAIDIFKDFTPQEVDDFGRYMYSVVSLQRMQRDPSYQPGEADAEVLESFVNEHKGDKFDEAAQQVTGYFNGLLLQMEDAGLITDVDVSRMTTAHELYMPFYRQFADENYSAYGGQFVNVKPPLKKLKTGSVMPVLDVYDAMVKRTNEVVGAINRKNIEDSMIDMMQKSGVADEFLRITNGPGPGVIRRVKDGVEEFYQIDPDLRDAMGRLGNPAANNLFLQVFNKIAKLPRGLMVNWNPAFAARNFPRDYKTAQIKGLQDLTGVEDANYTSALFAKPPWEVARNVALELGQVEKTDADKLYERLGGRLDRKMESVVADRDLLGRRRRRKIGKVEDSLIDHAVKLRDAFTLLNEATELAPRKIAFVETLRMLGEESGEFSVDSKGNFTGEIPEWAYTQAMSNAQEVTVNFNRRGAWAPFIEPFTLYFNAAMQGSFYSRGQVLANPESRNKLKIWLSLAATAHLLGLGAMAMLQSPDDEDKSLLDHYWEIPDYYRKSQSVFIAPGGVAIGIPREREWGPIQRIIEETARQAFGPEELAPKELVWNELKDVMLESVAATGGTVPTVGQLYLNYNIHYGEQIESEWDRKKYITEMYDSRTMAGSKFLSKHLLHHDIFFEGMSPKETDFLLRNMGFGTLQAWMDYGARPGDKIPFMVDEKARQSVNDFYVKQEEVTQQAQGLSAGVPLKNEAKIKEDHAAFALANTVMKKIRGLDIDDDMKAKYLTGIARWALGRQENSLYPNPLFNQKGLPPKVRAAINKSLATKRGEVKGEAKKRFRKPVPKKP